MWASRNGRTSESSNERTFRVIYFRNFAFEWKGNDQRTLILTLTLKAMSHEAICPFFAKKILQVQVGCQTYATCFATCNEIIFYARRVFKNVSGILIMSYCDWLLLKKLREKLQWGVSHTATCRVALWKVEAASTFSATCNAIFRCKTSCKHGVSHGEVFFATCNATPLRCKLLGKLPCVIWP